MEIEYKLVDYERYCKRCKFSGIVEEDDPCHDCLNEPVNSNSEKPLYFKPIEFEPKNRKERL